MKIFSFISVRGKGRSRFAWIRSRTCSGLVAGYVTVARLAPVTSIHSFGAEVDVTKLPAPEKTTVDFDRDVRPIFEASCLKCHGPERPKSRFSLVTRESTIKGGEHGEAVKVNDSSASPLIHYVARVVADMEMPPDGKGEPLTAQQVGILRSWIDQGAKWSEKDSGRVASLFSITPMMRWINVSGNRGVFREHTGMREGWDGGAQDFVFEERPRPGEKFRAEGSLLGNAQDYRLKLDYQRADVGFVRGGFEQYHRYYDDTGGYYAPFATNSFGSGRDLSVELGKVWIDFGLTLPHWPRMVLGYEYQYKEGTKSSLAWSEVEGDIAGAPEGRKIFPAYKNLDEKLHILKFDISHEIGGWSIEDNLRTEFYDLRSSRVESDDLKVGNPPPKPGTRADESTDQIEVVNTLRGEKLIREWFMVSGGYLYSKLNSEAAFTLSSPFLEDESMPITLTRESHVFNGSTRLGPWKGLTFVVGLQNEWTRELGFGSSLQTFNPGKKNQSTDLHDYSSNRSKALWDEDVGLRYTTIPYTVLFAEGRMRQEWIDHHESDDFKSDFNFNEFERFTDAKSDLYEYRTGFTLSPWRPVMLEGNFKHRLKEIRYTHLVDSTVPFDFVNDFVGNGYPGHILARDIELDQFELKLALRPASWLKTTFKYQLVATDYETTTAYSMALPLDSNDPITQPGGSLLAGNYDAHIYSASATMTPWRRLVWSTTFSYSDSRTVTGVNGHAGTVPYKGDIYSVLSMANVVIDEKTDWHVNYTYSRGNYDQDGASAALPLGISYERHGVMTGLARRFGKRITTHLQYGYFRYDEPSSGGVRDYTAHAILGMVNVKFE
ncbi:MAG: hypothetical protein EXS31_01760 [Pedosphaera sp.]|nr:hypothetical protein [Pedosphaera sp.]